MRRENFNLHGNGYREHEVYDMPSFDPTDYWRSVTEVPCPVDGCDQTIVWYEAGYVPGYRVCMRALAEPGAFDMQSIRHRFQAQGTGTAPVLVRDDCCERPHP